MRFVLISLMTICAYTLPWARGYQASTSVEISDRRYRALALALKRLQANGGQTPRFEIFSIQANLSRWKNLPADLGDTYIWVNIPAFRLELWSKNRLIVTMPVVVGKTRTPTPMLFAYLQSVDVQPEWIVPDSIAEGGLQTASENPKYRLKNGIHIQKFENGNWVAANDTKASKIRLIQDPGPANPLGHFRFNTVPYYKYRLHDSAARFDLTDRLLSHGCVRVQSAKRLFINLDRLSLLAKHEDIDALLRLERQTRIYFVRPIPVYFVYFTAWADRGNVIHYEPDIYGLDQHK